MVYVDFAQIPMGRMKMSHMMADGEIELHDMAQAIGVQRRWFQGDHYDICLSKRDAAIERGAQSVSSRFLANLRRARRSVGR